MNNGRPRQSSSMKIVGEEFRESIRSVQKERHEDQFKEIRSLFLMAFKKHNMVEQSPLDPNTQYWFMEPSKTSLPKYLDPQEIFKLCFTREKYISQTVGNFIDRLISEIEEIHLQCSNNEVDLSIAQESERILKEIVQNLKQKQIQQQQQKINIESINSMEIFYVIDNKYKDDIFKLYKIKYKAGSQMGNLQTVYSQKQTYSKIQDKSMKCAVEIKKDTSSVIFSIQGKPINQKQSDYEEIARIKVPFSEIISAIKPHYFEQENIPPAYLIIPYSAQNDLKFAGRQIDIEFGFVLNLSSTMRIAILEEQAIKLYVQEQLYFKNRVQKMSQLIDNILNYFKVEDLQYNGFQGLEIKKKKTRTLRMLC